MSTKIARPYLLFLGDVTEARYAKTAFGLKDWARNDCVGELALPTATVSTGLPSLTPAEAAQRGARSVVIGIANRGGVIASEWLPLLVQCLQAGLDIVSGMHVRLAQHPQIKAAAERFGRNLIDVRVPPALIPIASGRKRTGKRLLTVGTDCALGKKYTALALTRALRQRGFDVDFRATGQTGILIAGAGIPIDSVVADFVAGAAEMLSPSADAAHWDIVEGQGSLFHPSYSGVSLGLLHGTQPDVLVLCHEYGRDHIMGLEHYPVPTLSEAIDLHLRLARRTNANVRCAGVSLNTSALDQEAAEEELARQSDRLRLPVADPLRAGPAFERLVDACLA